MSATLIVVNACSIGSTDRARVVVVVVVVVATISVTRVAMLAVVVDVVKLFMIGARVGGEGASTDRARVAVATISVTRGGGTVVTTVVLVGTGTESGVVTLCVIGACVGGGAGAGIDFGGGTVTLDELLAGVAVATASVTRVVVTAEEVVGTKRGSGVVALFFVVLVVVGTRASGVVLEPLSLNTDDSR